MKTRYLWVLPLLLIVRQLAAQTFEEFSIRIEEIYINEMPALQSFAFGTNDDLWLLAGGRSDGLHEHMPPSAFPESGENTFLYVVAPETQEVWSATTTSLSESIQEQLGATNMQFYQSDTMLYLIGGYGYSEAAGDHITFPYLMAIHIPNLIQAIQTGNDIAPYIRQTEDERMAVTGGHLGKLENVYYLAGGQQFDGRYNPHGGGSFTQTYTNAIRQFELTDDGDALFIDNYIELYDSLLFHRRDYNMHPQINAEGDLYYTMFSGVFRYNADLPWLDAVHFDAVGYSPTPAVTQLLNQYHTASLPVYEQAPYAMHTLFFGGIGLYYQEGGTLYIDSLVPFTRNISRISRSGDTFSEYLMDSEMPGFIGASAEFIAKPIAAYTETGILRLDELPVGETAVGYIAGGIESAERNIFMLSGNSWASNRVFKVWLNRTGTLGTMNQPTATTCHLHPNPFLADVVVEWPYATKWNIQIYNLEGDLVFQHQYEEQRIQFNASMLPKGQYLLRCDDGEHHCVHTLMRQ